MTGDAIFIVDDDPGIRDALSRSFAQARYLVTSFPDGNSFLAAARDSVPDCVLLDMYMPGSSGLDVLRAIDARTYAAPIFMASARGDIPVAVEAMRRGAADFIEKRRDAAAIVEHVQAAMERSRGRKTGLAADLSARAFPGRETLTPREHEVVIRIAAGASNQQTADQLGISRRTVEVHRAHILDKLGARNTADLVRIVLS